MPINFDLITSIRELADWILQLPAKLVGTIMDPQVAYYERAERVRKAKELAEIREVGKALQSLFISKSSISHWAARIQANQDLDSVRFLRELFETAADQVEHIRSAMMATPISNLAVGTDVAVRLTRAKDTFRLLSKLTDQQLLDDAHLVEIMKAMEEMSEAGTDLIKRVDEHRTSLDSMYDSP